MAIRASIEDLTPVVDRRDDAIGVPLILRPTVDDSAGGIVLASPGGHTSPRGGSQGARKRGRQRPTSKDRRDPTVPMGVPDDQPPEWEGSSIPPLAPEVTSKTPPYIPQPRLGNIKFPYEELVQIILKGSTSVPVGVQVPVPIPQVCRPLCQPICQ